MSSTFHHSFANGRSVHGVFSTKNDGDFSLTRLAATCPEGERTLAPTPWYYLTQVHGSHVFDIDATFTSGAEGDGMVSDAADTTLAVLTADCVPVLFWSPQGVIGAAHAGWRGVVAGIVAATVENMRARGAKDVFAAVGPHICVQCYDFNGPEYETVVNHCGPDVFITQSGSVRLDMGAAVAGELTRCGVTQESMDQRCTAHDEHFYSYRARADLGRQVSAIWMTSSTISGQ